MRIVLVARDAGGVFQAGVQQGAREVLEADGLTLEVLDTPTGIEALAGATGVIALMNVLSAEDLLALDGQGIRLTLVSHSLPDGNLPAVMHDNRQGMGQLLAYLFADRGCTRPLLLGGEPTQLDAIEREAAFREDLMRRGIDPDSCAAVTGDFDPRVAAERFEAYLGQGTAFDSVIAADFLMAIAILPVLERHGLGHLPIAAFGDGPEAAAAGITTVAADVVELGRRAARQLLGQLPGRNPGRPLSGTTVLATELIRRSAPGTVEPPDGAGG